MTSSGTPPTSPQATRPTTLYHGASQADWDARSASHYQPAAYADEGFVHLSSAEQMVGTLHKHYLGRTDLVVLTVDSAAVEAELVWEDLYGSGMAFPHIYGPINLDAVSAATPTPCDDDGRFDRWQA